MERVRGARAWSARMGIPLRSFPSQFAFHSLCISPSMLLVLFTVVSTEYHIKSTLGQKIFSEIYCIHLPKRGTVILNIIE